MPYTGNSLKWHRWHSNIADGPILTREQAEHPRHHGKLPRNYAVGQVRTRTRASDLRDIIHRDGRCPPHDIG
jgi:hypothetical protein